MKNEIIYGDCLLEMPNIPDKSIDMVLADLPWGMTRNKWDIVIDLDLLWEQYKRIIKDKGAIVLTASQPFTSALVMSNIKMFKYIWVWKKGNKPTGFLNSKKQPLRIHEDILVFYKKQPVYNPQMTKGEKCHSRGKSVGELKNNSENYNDYIDVDTLGDSKYPQTLINFGRDKNSLHPTQKPVALFEYLIKTYTNEGDLVLDNTCGSGTTGVACVNTNRNYILMEKELKYYEIAKTRVEQAEAEALQNLL